MTATAHILVGGVIAATVPNPILGVSLAASSHIILDMIPHWDFGWGWREKGKGYFLAQSAFDVLLGLTLAFWFFGLQVNWIYLLACILASIGLDLLEAPYLFLNWHFPPFSWLYKLQSKLQSKAQLPWGLFNQIAVVGLIILIFYYHPF